MGVVFAKTPKGQEELTTRTGGLTPRQRRVLIMVDGKRTVDELREMLQTDDLQHTLGLLEEDGFIEVTGLKDNKGVVQAAPKEALPAINAFRPIPNPPNKDEMEKARPFHRKHPENLLRPFCPSAHC